MHASTDHLSLLRTVLYMATCLLCWVSCLVLCGHWSMQSDETSNKLITKLISFLLHAEKGKLLVCLLFHILSSMCISFLPNMFSDLVPSSFSPLLVHLSFSFYLAFLRFNFIFILSCICSLQHFHYIAQLWVFVFLSFQYLFDVRMQNAYRQNKCASYWYLVHSTVLMKQKTNFIKCKVTMYN